MWILTACVTAMAAQMQVGSTTRYTDTQTLQLPVFPLSEKRERGSQNSGRYIVVLKDSVDNPGAAAVAQTDEVDGTLGFVYRSALKGYSVADLSQAEARVLRKDPRVRFVVPDRKVEAFSQTVPTGISRTFAIENKELDIDGTDDVRVNADVAVIDTGIDYTHPDLNVVSRVNCIPANEETKANCVINSGTDGNGHGTHVAGTIGAIDNGFGVVGVAPGARLWAVRVLNDKGDGYDSWVIAGIDWVTARASEIEVANVSLGGEGTSAPMEAALDASLNAGVVYAVSAGNEEQNAEWQHPANDPDVITVSALSDTDGEAGGIGPKTCKWGPDDTLARFSNWGSVADIAAPGACIYSTWKEGGYGFDSGTSMASPHVAGAAAILASKSNPSSRSDVEAIRNSLVRGGNLDWLDTSNDGRAETLLYLGEKALTAVEVATGGYSSSDGETATLYGSINPRDQAVEYYFEYGQMTEYGQKASLNPAKISSGSKYQLVSQSVTGLLAEHLYHYRLVVKTESGNVYGRDHSFRPSHWSAQTPPNIPTSTAGEWLNDVSCGAAGACMAVGHYFNGDNLLSSYELSGGQWMFRDVPEPTGENVEGFSELDGVSCTAANACTAVGKFQVKGGIVVPLAERWNGSSWSIQTIPSPSESPYARLQDVSCSSATECIAVGYYKNTSGVWVNLSARWKSGSWSLLSTPNIEGTTESELRDVSCTSATFCMAVGRSEGPRQPLTMIWDGSSWSLQKGARVSGWLGGVSCTSPQFCMAVTAYPYAEVWDGEAWSVNNWALPEGGQFIWLNSVSCSTASFCRAVGEIHKESRRSSFAETWSSGTWKAHVGTRKAEATSNIWGVSCVLSFGCAAVGGERVGMEDLKIETYRSTSTVGASKVGASKATLNGLVNPEGIATTYRFEYGPTTSYGASIPVPDGSVGSGAEPVEVSQELIELPAETTFHYRLVVTNEKGTQYGADRVFRTGTLPPNKTSQFGYYGTDDGLFDRPKGVAVDSEGNIWVADADNHRVQKFNSKGEFLLTFGTVGTGNGQFSHPMDIAFTADGKLWVTDSGNARVQQFDLTGKYLGQFGSYGTAAGKLVYPKGIAIAPDGHIWVTDHLYGRVQEFTATGEFVRAVGDTNHGGNGQTSFSYPDGIAISPDGRVWVVDRRHDKVQTISSTGQFLSQFGVEGEGLGELQEPSAIDIKPSGDLLVTNRRLGRIQQFDSSGNYVTKFDRGDGWASEQEGLAVAPHGVVYVVQSTASRVERWVDPSPEVLTQAATSVSAEGASLAGAVNPRGIPTGYHFEFGPTTSYGSRVPVTSKEVGSGTTAVAVSENLSGLNPWSTYHFRLVASNGDMTVFGEDRTFTTTIGAGGQLAGMAVTEPFDATSSAVSDFATDWTGLGWAGGSPAKGENSLSGWRPVGAFPTVNGAFYSSTITDTGSGIAAIATMAANPKIASRYFSLWLDMSSPAGARAGYELKFTYTSAGNYDVALSKWVGGSQTVLASQSSVAFADGNSFALVDKGSAVSAWTNTASGFSQLISAGDSTFDSGKAAVEGSGNITRLTKFKVGSLLTPSASIDVSLKELALNDSFGTNEAPLSGGGAWTALSWANGTSGNNTGRVSGGWGPYDAYSAINGAYWTKATMPDTGSGVGVTATLVARPAITSRYFSLWLHMPSPLSARTGYELRFTETSANLYEVALSKWQAGTKTVLASKTSYSFPVNSQFALADNGPTVSVWTKAGSEYAQLLSASDSAFKTGYTGIEGSGNITRLKEFRSGPLAPF